MSEEKMPLSLNETSEKIEKTIITINTTDRTAEQALMELIDELIYLISMDMFKELLDNASDNLYKFIGQYFDEVC